MQLSPVEFVVQFFGGVRATARALNMSPNAVSKWHHKPYLPSKRIPQILEIAKKNNLDITIEDLVYGREIKDGKG